MRTSVTLAAVAISVSLVCYVARTVLLQGQAMKDKALLQRRNEQLEHLAIRDPLTGIGKPEQLKHVLQGCWSRRIDEEHRLVYLVDGDDVVILQARYHYEH